MAAPPIYRDGGPSMPQVSFPRLTPAVKGLLIVLAAIHLATFVLFMASESLYETVISPLQLDPHAWSAGFPLVPVWQVFTYGLLHSAVDVMHLLGNLLMLYFFGTMLEEELGTRRFLITYVSAQVAGALAFLVPAWLGMNTAPAVGASGACFGVMIAVATMFPSRIVYLLFVPVPLKWLALIILVITVFSGLVQMKYGATGTAHLVHFGGIAYGFLAVRSGLVHKDPVEILEQRRAANEVHRAESDAQRLDQLLVKIKDEGIGSLSKSEREFLKKASARK